MQHFIEQMGVVSNIDRLVQAHTARTISHGETVAALMVYLLSGGRALYRMEQWAGQTAALSWLFPKYGPEEWTDDRLADTLDALYHAGLESVQGELSAHIVDAFGLKLSEIHYDTTSVSLWGTYDADQNQPAVLVTFGYSKDHRPDLKQVVVGSAVSGDGGVPLLSKTHDGNTNDSTVPIPYWERLRQLAGTSRYCFIGDCKLASEKTLKAICSADGIFLSPLPMSATEQASIREKLQSNTLVFTSCELPEDERLKPVYAKRTEKVGNRRKRSQTSEEEQGRGAQKQETEKARKESETYDVFEETTELRDHRNRPHTIRRLIMRSSALLRKHANTRERHLRTAEEGLQELRGKLNTRKLKNRAAIETAVKKIVQQGKGTTLMEVSVEENHEIVRKQVGRGRPGPNTQYVEEERIRYDLTSRRLQDKIDEKALLDGIFILATNHETTQWPASRILALYKRQYKVEQVFRVLKGPLAVSPMLLEKPERICAMVFLMTLTLQRYTLIRRQAMLALEARNRPLSGLMPNNIQTWRPQTDGLLAAFENINVVEYYHDGRILSDVTSLNETQIDILTILGVATERYRFT